MAASSTCMAPPPPPLTVRGTHQFEIVGYSLVRGLAAGEFVRSGNFAVGGYKWSVLFYPGGFSAPYRRYASIFIKLMSYSARAWARFELRLVDRATGLSRTVYQAAARPVVFDKSVMLHKKFKSKRGVREFMARGELEASAYVRDDRLTVECVLDVVADEERLADVVALSQVRVPPPDLSKHLGGLLLNQQDQADITLDVQDEIFQAHKAVLAMRSPVFKAQLYGPMKEKEMGCIAVDDMQPVVFRALLHFIYTDVLLLPGDLVGGDEYTEMVRHLLEAADRYGMERLKLICESILCRSLDGNTVAATLALADQHYCKTLKDVCVQFMSLGLSE